MKRHVSCLLLATILGTTGAFVGGGASQAGVQSSQPTTKLAYHDHPPDGPIVPTLDPDEFKDDHAAFVAYSRARKTEKILFQVPCYCPCNKEEGHASLRDCFVGKHGVQCPICQKEVIYCYEQQRKGRNAAQIRRALAAGNFWKVDVVAYVDRTLKTNNPR